MSASFFSLKRGLAAGGAVLLLGGSAVGIASAQTAPAGTPSTTSQTPRPGYQAFLDALAKRLNISSSTLQTAIDQARTDAGLPAGGGFGHDGGGPGGPGRPGRGGEDLNAAATAIGIPVAQLQQELATKSLADVATAHVIFAGSQIGPHVGLATAGAGDLGNLLRFDTRAGQSRELHSRRRCRQDACAPTSHVADRARQTQAEAAGFAGSLNRHAAQAGIVGAENRISNQQDFL